MGLVVLLTLGTVPALHGLGSDIVSGLCCLSFLGCNVILMCFDLSTDLYCLKQVITEGPHIIPSSIQRPWFRDVALPYET